MVFSGHPTLGLAHQLSNLSGSHIERVDQLQDQTLLERQGTGNSRDKTQEILIVEPLDHFPVRNGDFRAF